METEIMVKFVNKQKALFSSLAYGNPSKKLKIIGVTGTRGKTVVAHMIYHILKESGKRVGYISTLGYTTDMQNFQKDVTANMIQAGDIYRLLGLMVKNGLEYAVVEMTSHMLQNNYYDGLVLDSGVVTNIYLDKPDVYNEWENYARTKLDFISKIKSEGLLVLNNQAPEVSNWIVENTQNLKNNIFTYWIQPSNVSGIQNSIDRTTFDFERETYSIPVITNQNIINALQASKIANSYVGLNDIKRALETFQAPTGRMEVIQKSPFAIIIDYAYTVGTVDDALRYLHTIKPYTGKIITVIGASGDSHKDRRNVAAIAARYSNMVVLAAEDPRNERVADINPELHLRAQREKAILVERVGSNDEYKLINKKNLRKKVEMVMANNDVPFVAFDAEDFTSRLDAIDFAVKFANPGDIVYITGKGHENTLSFANVDYEWSDTEAVKQALGLSKQ